MTFTELSLTLYFKEEIFISSPKFIFKSYLHDISLNELSFVFEFIGYNLSNKTSLDTFCPTFTLNITLH